MLGSFFLLSIFLLILGPFFTISLGSLNVYPFDLGIFVSSLYFLTHILKNRVFRIDLSFILFLAFCSFALITTIFSVKLENLFGALLYLFRFVTYFLFSYFVYLLVLSGDLKKEEILRYLKISSFFLIITSFIQYFFFRDISFMSFRGFDPHTTRMSGFFLDPNFLGIFIVIFYYENSQYFKNIYFEYLFIFMVFLTQSRSALLSLLICIFLLNYKRIDKIFLNVVFISLLFFLNSSILDRISHASAANDSSYLRIESWKNGIYLYSFSDLFGVGLNNYRNSLISTNLISPEFYSSNSSSYSDSSLISVLAMTGLIGLVLFILIFTSYLNNFFSLVLLVVIFFNSVIINSLFYPAVTVFLFLLLNLNRVKY